jgi:hypothetical protein
MLKFDDSFPQKAFKYSVIMYDSLGSDVGSNSLSQGVKKFYANKINLKHIEQRVK